VVNLWIFGTRQRSIDKLNTIVDQISDEIGDRYQEIKKQASEMEGLMTILQNFHALQIQFQQNPNDENLESLRRELGLLKAEMSNIKKEELKIEHIFLIIDHKVKTVESIIDGVDREKAGG